MRKNCVQVRCVAANAAAMLSGWKVTTFLVWDSTVQRAAEGSDDMIMQCMKCGWAQVAANHTVADIMEEDHLLDDQCVGEVRRMQNA